MTVPNIFLDVLEKRKFPNGPAEDYTPVIQPVSRHRCISYRTRLLKNIKIPEVYKVQVQVVPVLN
jgi:hypothetical protein